MHPTMAWNIRWSVSVEVLALGEWRTTLWLTRRKWGGPDQEKSWWGGDIRWGNGKTCLCLGHTCGAENPLLTLPLLGFKASIPPSLKCQDRSSPETVTTTWGDGFLLGKLPGEFPNPLDNFRESLRQTHNFVSLKIQSPWCHLLRTQCLQGSSASLN